MSLLALVILIVSACMHATWNFLAKQSNGGNIFVWLYSLVSTVFLTPAAVFMFYLDGFNLGWLEIGLIVGSVLLHIVYSVSLQYGYRIGDLSLVYPVARGTGPFIVAVSAIFIYGETLTWLSGSGILLIVVSIFILSGGLNVLSRPNTKITVFYGMYVGLVIASYTLVDKGAMSASNLSPIIYFYAVTAGQFLMLTPVIWRKRHQIRKEWQTSRKFALGVGILNPFAYILVLAVMSFTPVSHVAPVREMSILFGTIMGIVLLREQAGRERIIGAVLMVVGVALIALS